MLKRILSISGRSGLFRLVNQGKNSLIVEELATGKRIPVFSRDKVSSLGDIAMYTFEGDKPLVDVLESLKAKAEAKPVDPAVLKDEKQMVTLFAQVLPEYDTERVHKADIRKLITWYNALLAAGITDFADKEEEQQGENTTDAAPAEA